MLGILQSCCRPIGVTTKRVCIPGSMRCVIICKVWQPTICQLTNSACPTKQARQFNTNGAMRMPCIQRAMPHVHASWSGGTSAHRYMHVYLSVALQQHIRTRLHAGCSNQWAMASRAPACLRLAATKKDAMGRPASVIGAGQGSGKCCRAPPPYAATHTYVPASGRTQHGSRSVAPTTVSGTVSGKPAKPAAPATPLPSGSCDARSQPATATTTPERRAAIPGAKRHRYNAGSCAAVGRAKATGQRQQHTQGRLCYLPTCADWMGRPGSPGFGPGYAAQPAAQRSSLIR